MSSPYRGLTPYTEDDAAYFFGRAREIATTTANLEVARLTIFYGPSGVGKSSVLRAGVLHQLQRRAQASRLANGPLEPVPIYFNRWQTEPLVGLTQATVAAIQQTTGDPNAAASDPAFSFVAQLRRWCEQSGRDLLFILDQFEEYFLYQGEASGLDSVAYQLVQAINSTQLRANFLLSLREDALARLDHFKGQIPFLLDNRLSIQHLDRQAGYEAVTAPLQQYNRQYGFNYSLEPALVEAVLDQVSSGKVALSKQGSGVSVTQGAGERIEAPYLQLVLTRLWEHETQAGATLLRHATLESLGGAAKIVANHLKDTMRSLSTDEQAMAAHFFDRLITPSGAKIALTVDDLAQYAETGAEQVQAVLQKLQEKRLVRGVQSPAGESQYEIFHDVLGSAMLEWQTNYEKEQEEAQRRREEQQARAEAERRAVEAAERAVEQRSNRILRWLLGGVAGLALLSILLALVARSQSQLAAARLLAFQAKSTAETQSDIALLLAAEAYHRQSNDLADVRASLLAATQCCAGAVEGFLRGHTNRVWDVAFHPTQPWLASGGEDGVIIIWDLTTRRPITTLINPESAANIYTVAFSHDGRLLAAGDGDGAIVLRDTQQWQAVGAPLREHTGAVYSVAFNGDDAFLVSGGIDQQVMVWDVSTGQTIATAQEHKDWVWDVTFSPDGHTIASAGRYGDLVLWDFQPDGGLTHTQILTASASGRLPLLTSVAFNQDQERPLLAAAGRGTDFPIILWDLRPWQQARQPPIPSKPFPSKHSETVWGVNFSPTDAHTLVSSSQSGTVRVWEVEAGQGMAQAKLTAVSLGMTAGVGGLFRSAISPDGKLVAAGGFDHLVKLWSTEPNKLVIRHPTPVRNLGLAEDGQTLVASSEDGLVRTWRTATQQAHSMPTITLSLGQPITVTALSPDGKLLAAANVNRGVALWETATGRRAITLTGLLSPLRSLLFSSDGRLLVGGDQAGRLILWNLEQSQPMTTVQAHSSLAVSLAFAPDGSLLASGGCVNTLRRTNTFCQKGEIRLWEMPTLRPQGLPIQEPMRAINALQFHPQQPARLAVGSSDGTVVILNLQDSVDRLNIGLRDGSTGQEVLVLAFSPNGQYLAVGRNTFAFTLYDTVTGEPFGKTFRDHDAAITALAFSPDGNWLFSGSRDNTVVAHDLNVAAWAERACHLVSRNLTRAEWRRYFGNAAYHKTCPEK